jgi:hypothetical protein
MEGHTESSSVVDAAEESKRDPSAMAAGVGGRGLRNSLRAKIGESHQLSEGDGWNVGLDIEEPVEGAKLKAKKQPSERFTARYRMIPHCHDDGPIGSGKGDAVENSVALMSSTHPPPTSNGIRKRLNLEPIKYKGSLAFQRSEGGNLEDAPKEDETDSVLDEFLGEALDGEVEDDVLLSSPALSEVSDSREGGEYASFHWPAKSDNEKTVTVNQLPKETVENSQQQSLEADKDKKESGLSMECLESVNNTIGEHDDYCRLSTQNGTIQWMKSDLVGEGTFGKVYRGVNTANGEVLALKQLYLADESDAEVENLRKEINVMWKLDHENIVRLGFQSSLRPYTNDRLCFNLFK